MAIWDDSVRPQPQLALNPDITLDRMSKAFSPTATTFEGLRLITNYATISLRMISSMLTADSNSDWKSLYEAAVCETDRSKLAHRVATARSAILNHIEESVRNPAIGEHCAMDAALRKLRRLAKV